MGEFSSAKAVQVALSLKRSRTRVSNGYCPGCLGGLSELREKRVSAY
jgi:hypothetical protein